jgi:acyl-phosphate glycerol 3-phosphate acyltransferase
MNPAALLILVLVVAYLAGAVPFGYLVARWRGVDILHLGSGNIGATNVGRVLGREFGLLVFLLDFLKGAVPVGAAKVFTPADLDLPPDSLPAAAAVAAFLGHLFPVYLRFRGGKGVATGAGAVVVLTPVPAAFALLTWVSTLAVTRYVSVSSLLACMLLCAARVMLTPEPWAREHIVVSAFCFVAAALVFVRHHSNIRRLLQGTENRLRETPAVLLVSKVIHLLALGLWFGTLVFFVVIGLLLFDRFENEATRSDDQPFGWVPHVRPYDAARRMSDTDRLPAWMRKEPGTRVAGFAVAVVFPWYFGIQDVCGLLAAATALAWTASHTRRVHRVRAYVLLAALISVVAGGWLERKVAENTAPRNALTDAALTTPTTENIARAEAARAEFWRLHLYSMVLNLVTLLLVTAAMALAARLPTTAPTGEAASNGQVSEKQQAAPASAGVAKTG